ncbi:MAG: DUF4097 family beta strand repeat protein [Clostridia bacterium]|nr:DUF4097 family beta strand repeat protein [Clostridia bacterium]
MKRIIAFISAVLTVSLILGGCAGIDRLSSGAYTEGERTVADEIYKIDIDWAQGRVIVIGSEHAEEITVKDNAGDGTPLATRIIGSVLYIKAAKPGKEAGEKSLTVIVPAGYNYSEIEIRTQSANAGIRKLKASRADIKTASGNISVVACDIDDEAELESETGNITANGNIADYDIQTVSGEISITTDFIPEDLDAESVDGAVIISLPADTPVGSVKAKTGGAVTNQLTNKEKGNGYTFKSETGNIFLLENINSK